MDIFNEEQPQERLTLLQLYNIIENIIEKDKRMADLPVFLSEVIIRKGKIEYAIQHMKKDDIKYEDLTLNDNVVSLFEKGIVIGYIPTTE